MLFIIANEIRCVDMARLWAIRYSKGRLYFNFDLNTLVVENTLNLMRRHWHFGVRSIITIEGCHLEPAWPIGGIIRTGSCILVLDRDMAKGARQHWEASYHWLVDGIVKLLAWSAWMQKRVTIICCDISRVPLTSNVSFNITHPFFHPLTACSFL